LHWQVLARHGVTGSSVAVWDAVYTTMLARVQWRKIKSW